MLWKVIPSEMSVIAGTWLFWSAVLKQDCSLWCSLLAVLISVYSMISIFCHGNKNKDERSKKETAVGFTLVLILNLASCCSSWFNPLPPVQVWSFLSSCIQVISINFPPSLQIFINVGVNLLCWLFFTCTTLNCELRFLVLVVCISVIACNCRVVPFWPCEILLRSLPYGMWCSRKVACLAWLLFLISKSSCSILLGRWWWSNMACL